MLDWLIPILVFIAVMMMITFMQKWIQQILLSRNAMAAARIKDIDRGRDIYGGRLEKLFFRILPDIGRWQQKWLNPDWKSKIVKRISFHPKWQFRSADQWLAAKELTALAAIVTGYAVMTDLWWAILAGLAGFYLPDLWLFEKSRQRKQSIIRSFPNTLDILSSCMDAGLVFEQAVTVILERSRRDFIFVELN